MSSTDDLTARASALSTRVDVLRSQQAQAEARVAAEQGVIDRTLAQLQADFGVSSLEAAQELLVRVDAKLSEECSLIESELAGTGSDG